MTGKYRYENGTLYILAGDAYIACYQSIAAATMEQAIEEYRARWFSNYE